jgi:hypothetical protein
VLKVWDITSAPQKQVLEKQKARLQLKKHNYFNFAESKSEAEECSSIREVLPQARLTRSDGHTSINHTQATHSTRE